MHRLHFTIIALGLLAASTLTQAGHEAVSCNGCSDTMKANLARTTTNNGKVFVFDAERRTVSSFIVTSEVLDSQSIGTWSEVRPVATNRKLRTAWRNYVRAQEEAIDYGTIYLPQDFPVLSVAGALVDPRFASTAIEEHLIEVNRMAALLQSANSLLGKAMQFNIGVLDMKNFITHILVTVEFQDGSTLDIKLDLAINPGNSTVRPEVEIHGNAIAPDGTPVPYTPLGFRNRTFTDHNGSLEEWIFYARASGIPVTGAGGGGTGGAKMVCTINANRISCIVILSE